MKITTLTLISLAATTVAHAQWQAFDIHPPGGYTQSFCNMTDGTRIYGTARKNGVTEGGYIEGGVFNSLNPAGASASGVSALDGGAQYGAAVFNGDEHAGRWFDFAGSWQDWNPTGSTNSQIYTAKNGKAGGYATFGGVQKATVWNGGGKDDTTDLHDNSWISSSVDAMDGNDIFGDAQVSAGVHNAGKWTNGAWTNLNPNGALGSQIISAVNGTQSGWILTANGYQASLWQGTAASQTNLATPGFDQSVAFDLRGQYVAGTAWSGLNSHAGFWNGGAFTDLHAFVSQSFTHSAAYGVEVLGGRVYVFGEAWNTQLELHHAMVWSQPVPEPGTLLGAAPLIALALRRKRPA